MLIYHLLFGRTVNGDSDRGRLEAEGRGKIEERKERDKEFSVPAARPD